MNILIVASQRFDDLWRDDQSLLNDQEASIIVMDARVVGARSDGHQVIRKAFDTIWANRVRSDHHA